MDYVTAEGVDAAFNVSNATASIPLVKSENNAIAKLLGNSNPLIDYDYGADPFALVYDGRVYVYMTADQYEYDEEGNLIDNTYQLINKLQRNLFCRYGELDGPRIYPGSRTQRRSEMGNLFLGSGHCLQAD